MGREATCHCQWANESDTCKVLVETHDLIFRGAIRRSVPIASLAGIAVAGSKLQFTVAGEQVSLTLGADLAQKWAKKLSTPPPTLASKLGIGPAIRLELIGNFDTIELQAAIADAPSADAAASPGANLILARVSTAADLNHALDVYAFYPGNPPIWIIYPKGSGKPIGETEIRNTLRQEGFTDTKVAAVSSALTALRFNKRS